MKEKSGLELFNQVMGLVAKIRSYDVVILIGSRQRINWSSALLDKECWGSVLGITLTEDKYIDPITCGELLFRHRKIEFLYF